MAYTPIPTVVPVSPFDAVADAEVLRNAMKGFGTNEQEIIDLLSSRSNAQRQQIASQFSTVYERDLVEDLKSELGGNFEDVIVALMQSPVEYMCEQLHVAMAGIGTDEPTLVEILCTKTNEEIQAIVDAYESKYGRPLAEQMCSETSGHFRRLLTLIVTGVRNASDSGVNPEKAKEQAVELQAAGVAKLGTDEEIFNRIMAHNNFAQLRLIFNAYKELSGETIEQAINQELDDELHEAMIAIVECVQCPAAFFAQRLHKAMDGAGTDDATLIRIIVCRSELDLGSIKEEYERIFNQTLISAITDSETSGDYKRALAALLGGA